MWNPFQRAGHGRYSENFLLVTYDSCRFDSYEAARTPVLDAHETPRKTWSQATYTFASHASMFQGMLPHAFVQEDYYNRFVRQLWRLSHRKTGDEPRVRMPKGARGIIDGFNRLGYFTCGVAAMGWFRNNAQLREHWQAFEWTGIAARRQLTWTKDQIARHRKRPFFAFINFGETHTPYEYDLPPGSEGDAAARKALRKGVAVEEWEFDEEKWRKQVACTEYLDERMGELLAFFSDIGKDVTVVVCGDHGDCFGEDGLYGHGFYHPKVMEVPMAIFDYKASAGRRAER